MYPSDPHFKIASRRNLSVCPLVDSEEVCYFVLQRGERLLHLIGAGWPGEGNLVSAMGLLVLRYVTGVASLTWID